MVVRGFLIWIGGSSENLSFRHSGNGGEEAFSQVVGWYAWRYFDE